MTDNKEVETIKVEVFEDGDEYFMLFNFNDPIRITLTSSDSTLLKTFFVQLIENMKNGKFKLVFESEAEDIYSNITRSYIQHLNTEISTIFTEMESLSV